MQIEKISVSFGTDIFLIRQVQFMATHLFSLAIHLASITARRIGSSPELVNPLFHATKDSNLIAPAQSLPVPEPRLKRANSVKPRSVCVARNATTNQVIRGSSYCLLLALATRSPRLRWPRMSASARHSHTRSGKSTARMRQPNPGDGRWYRQIVPAILFSPTSLLAFARARSPYEVQQ